MKRCYWVALMLIKWKALQTLVASSGISKDLVSRSIMGESLRWLGHFLQMKSSFSANRLELNGNQVVHGLKDIAKKHRIREWKLCCFQQPGLYGVGLCQKETYNSFCTRSICSFKRFLLNLYRQRSYGTCHSRKIILLFLKCLLRFLLQNFTLFVKNTKSCV